MVLRRHVKKDIEALSKDGGDVAEAARDALLTRAAHTGAATQSELAQLAGVTRGRVNQIIHR